MTALIIDDEPDICYLLSRILRKKNIEVNYVNTLAEAALVLQKQDPGIIFLDNHLPDGRGVDFIKQLKRHNPFSKIVLITAYDTAADRIKATQKGADFFIAKPFKDDTVYEAVDRFHE